MNGYEKVKNMGHPFKWKFQYGNGVSQTVTMTKIAKGGRDRQID